MSAESGISTFRDSGGLWEKYEINEVATPEAWRRNPDLVAPWTSLDQTKNLFDCWGDLASKVGW